jgi:hypothetical protein
MNGHRLSLRHAPAAAQRIFELDPHRASLRVRRFQDIEHEKTAICGLEPPHDASSWPIGELLQAQRHWGSTKCTKFLSRNQINETKPLHALTQRQRQLLASELSFCWQQTTEAEPALSA